MSRFSSKAAARGAGTFAILSVLSHAASSAEDSAAPALDEVVVIAQRLNEARNGIQTQTGASTYTFNEAAIGAQPGGDNQLLNQVIMQAPKLRRTHLANSTSR
jgi:hypothetical protein